MGIFLGEPEIALLYNDPNVKFTLEEFEKITKDKERLKIYRE